MVTALTLAIWIALPRQPEYAKPRDCAVISALVKAMVSDRDFYGGRRAARPVFLSARNPEESAVIDGTVDNQDLRSLPAAALHDLRTRNLSRGAEGTREFRYDRQRWPEDILVTRAAYTMQTRSSIMRKGAGYVEAWAPGYSPDGRTAVVIGNVGPSAHGGRVVAVLRNQDGRWGVEWKHVVFFR